MVEAGRVLALDAGERRIGVAVSDPTRTVVSPVAVITRSTMARDLERLEGLLEQYGPERVVVGLPISLSGEIGPQARRVLEFVERLRRLLRVPVETWDERFSTVDAHEILRAQGLKTKRHRDRVDAVAAASILEAYLQAGPAGTRQPPRDAEAES